MSDEFNGGAEDSRNAEERDALTPKQELVLGAILSGASQKEAARAAGVSETTVWRYHNDRAFAKGLREARVAATGHSMARLQQISGDAVAVLHGLMMKEDAPAAARITAARTALDYSFRSAEVEELKSRLDLLEEFLRRKREEDDLDAACERERG